MNSQLVHNEYSLGEYLKMLDRSTSDRLLLTLEKSFQLKEPADIGLSLEIALPQFAIQCVPPNHQSNAQRCMQLLIEMIRTKVPLENIKFYIRKEVYFSQELDSNNNGSRIKEVIVDEIKYTLMKLIRLPQGGSRETSY